MSLYSEYLEAKSDLLSKDLAFKTAVEDWFREHEGLMLMQPIDLIDTLTMDHFTITTTMAFEKHLRDFEETFQVKCIRITHQEVLTPITGEEVALIEYNVKHVWKFHFREKK
ncbi:hypothetical protein [uncultured Methanobrevibacter sp.]|uniref:hypothetical protein n=1 Tax=uncultured Methanobrevibacter sp. TaxID=253161 RepID=UPI0025DEBAA5|nr:hypothetical protein [uncultured Methanobrevibacter sp.]